MDFWNRHRPMESREEGMKRLFSMLSFLLWCFALEIVKGEGWNENLVQSSLRKSASDIYDDKKYRDTDGIFSVNRNFSNNNNILYDSDTALTVNVIRLSSKAFTDITSELRNKVVDVNSKSQIKVLNVPLPTTVNTALLYESLITRSPSFSEDVFGNYLNYEYPLSGRQRRRVTNNKRRTDLGLSLKDPMEDDLGLRGRSLKDPMEDDLGLRGRSLKDPMEDEPESRKRSDVNTDIDGIIRGIMKLLGGKVKIKSPEDTKLTTFGNDPSGFGVTSTRINNRGPPKLPPLPLGMFAHVPGFTRPPIRPPITPPTGDYSDGRPPFVANTMPPFLVSLPPALTTRLVVPKPFITGIPIPEDVLTHLSTHEVPEDENTKFHTDEGVEAETTISPSFHVFPDEVTSFAGWGSTPLHGSVEVTTSNLENNINEHSSTTEKSQVSSSAESSVTLEPSMMSSTTLSSSFQSSVVKASDDRVEKSSTTNLVVPTMTSVSSSMEDNMLSWSVPKKGYPPKRPLYGSPSQPETSTYSATSTPSLGDSSRPIFDTTGHPGVVLADSVDYQPEVVTAPLYRPSEPDFMVVTVSASQGYGSIDEFPNTKETEATHSLIGSQNGVSDWSVFIDGRKTYFDLMPATTSSTIQTTGFGTVIPERVEEVPRFPEGSFQPISQPSHLSIRKPSPTPGSKPPTLGPPKRIDTCIVGYDTTCNEELGEVCRTEGDVSSCFCRPGTARRRPRMKCNKSVLLHLSLKVDRVGDRRIFWSGNYGNPEAREYQVLAYEAEKALDNALSQSQAMSQLYLESFVNKFYSLGGRVIVNSTVKLLHTPQTSSPNIKRSLQRHLIRIIQGHNNHIGNSMLAIEGTLNPIPDVSDVNECLENILNDCNNNAVCSNIFGSYTCGCKKGFSDRFPDDPTRSGRVCDSCSRDFCSKKGECRVEDGQNVCVCELSFYGSRCEIDGEVIAVAVGASVAAVVIIVLTLIFLCMWSRRWKAQDRKTEIITRRLGGGFFGWRNRFGARPGFAVSMQKGGAGAYGVTMEDRIRWAQIAEQLTHQNLYTLPNEGTVSSATLASSAISSLGTLSIKTPEEGRADPSAGTQSKGWRRVRRRMLKNLLSFFPKVADWRRKDKFRERRFTSEEVVNPHQLLNLQTRLGSAAFDNQPNQLQPAAAFYPERKAMPLPAEYASVGSITNPFAQQFGLQHMGHPFLPYPPCKTVSTYGQFGPPGINSAPSVGGISRAPTVGARTPVPLRDKVRGNSATIGPIGGGVVGQGSGGGSGSTDSSGDDTDRPYHLPRPKSRSSTLDSTNDLYFEPDDSRNPPLPLAPPPPLPFLFDQYFKTHFP